MYYFLTANNLVNNYSILVIKYLFYRQLRGLSSTSIIIKIELLLAEIFRFKANYIYYKYYLFLTFNNSANNSSIFIIIDVLDSPLNYLQNEYLIIKIEVFYIELLAVKNNRYFYKKLLNLEIY